MAKFSSADIGAVAINGYDVKGVLTDMMMKKAASIEETTAFGMTWQAHEAVGTKNFELSASGFYDDAADSINAALSGQQGIVQIVMVELAGNVSGRKFVGFQGPLLIDYTRGPSLNALHKASATYMGSGQVDEGVILQKSEAKTVDWDTTGAESVDNGASSANGGVGYMEIIAFSGFSGFIGKIRHSTDDSTYTDLITFTNATGIGAQRIAVAGTVNRHLAFDGNVTGSGSIIVLAGFARG